MLRLRVMDMLEARGKTKYWLYKQLGMSYTSYDNMIRNRTGSIKYEYLEAMCIIFQCSPGDLFEFDPSIEN